MTDAKTIDFGQNPAPEVKSIKGDLTAGDISAHLFRLSVPMVWGILAIISFQLVDSFYVSRLGPQPLAAIGFTFPVTMTAFSLLMGFSIATSSVVSRLIGSGDLQTMKRAVAHGLLIAFIAGSLLALIGYAVTTPLFTAMGAASSMMGPIRDYTALWFVSVAFLSIPLVSNAAMRASGDSKTPALIMVGVALINLVLDPFFIFGLYGFPRLELQGAALATLIANIGGALAALYVLSVRKKILCRDSFRGDHFSDSLKRILIVAVPAGLTAALHPLSNSVIVSLLSRSGDQVVAAFGIVSRIEAFAFVIIMALSTGMVPVVGQNWGARYFDRVSETLSKAFLFVIGWSLFIAAILGSLSSHIAKIFSDDAVFIETVTLYFWIVPVSYAVGNLVQGWASAFNAIGMAYKSATMVFVKTIVCTIPFAFVGNYFYGPIGVFAALAGVNILTGVGFHLKNRAWFMLQKKTLPLS